MSTGANNILYSKENTRMQILKLIATRTGLTRTKLAALTSLSKMSVSNIVSDLIDGNFIVECENTEETNVSGRKPVCLKLSEHSPCICGMLIERDFIQVFLGDLGGAMLTDAIRVPLSSSVLTHDEIIASLYDAFCKITSKTSRSVAAIGISSLGPLNAKTGVILRPPFFHNITNLPIVEKMSTLTQLPVFLMNESNACALAEHLYGNAFGTQHFLYLHITNGIGAGVVLDGKLFDGEFGQNGGLGHISINAFGPKCECGSNGCLELYANLRQLQQKINELKCFHPGSRLALLPSPSWIEILDGAHMGDLLALLALEEFCGYIALAICSTLNILDLSTIILDYPFHIPGDSLETLLHQKLLQLRPIPFYHDVTIQKSVFIGNAAAIGSIAIVADKIFNMELPMMS